MFIPYDNLEWFVPSFCSFLVFPSTQTELVEIICRRAGWKVDFIPDPSKRFRFFTNGYSEASQRGTSEEFGSLREGEHHGQLLTVEAERTEANNIIQLIRAADVIIEGFPDQKYGKPSVFEIPNDETEQASIFENIFLTTGFFEFFSFKMERPVSVALAANAWLDSRTIYAIHKL